MVRADVLVEGRFQHEAAEFLCPVWRRQYPRDLPCNPLLCLFLRYLPPVLPSFPGRWAEEEVCWRFQPVAAAGCLVVGVVEPLVVCCEVASKLRGLYCVVEG